MSINYCTISTNSIDGFCGNQRAKVLTRLIEEKYAVVQPPTPQPPGGGWAYGPITGIIPGIRPDTWAPPYRPPRDLDHDLPTYEQPWITVTAEIFNFRGSETLETTIRLDFVTITELEFLGEDNITVNINEMEFKHAGNWQI